METIAWGGHRFGPNDLFGAAREARTQRWLDEPSRQLLHHAGACLAAARPLAPAQVRALGGVLGRLQRLGSAVIATTPRLDAAGPGAAAAQGRLAEIEREVAALRLCLASASERLELHQEIVHRLLQGLAPEAARPPAGPEGEGGLP